MSFSSLPIRSNAAKIYASWWNDIRTALINAFGTIISETQFTIANNQSVSSNITGLIFDSTEVVCAEITMSITRVTSTVNIRSLKKATALFRAGGWFITQNDDGDSSGITLAINSSTGQVSYTSTNESGTGYVGKARFKVLNSFSVES